MKNLYSLSSPSLARLVYKNAKENSDKDTHERVSNTVRQIAQAPLSAVNYINDKVHGVLKKIPVAGHVARGTHAVSKGVIKAGNSVVGGVAEAGSQGVTHVAEGAGKVVSKTGKGLVNAGKGLVGHKDTLSDREKKESEDYKKTLKKRKENAKVRKVKRQESARVKKAEKQRKAEMKKAEKQAKKNSK